MGGQSPHALLPLKTAGRSGGPTTTTVNPTERTLTRHALPKNVSSQPGAIGGVTEIPPLDAYSRVPSHARWRTSHLWTSRVSCSRQSRMVLATFSNLNFLNPRRDALS